MKPTNKLDEIERKCNSALLALFFPLPIPFAPIGFSAFQLVLFMFAFSRGGITEDKALFFSFVLNTICILFLFVVRIFMNNKREVKESIWMHIVILIWAIGLPLYSLYIVRMI